MANNFYNPTGSPTTRAAASSANMRAEFAAIGTAFDKLPALTANAYKIAYVNGAGTALAAAQEFYIDAAGSVSIGASSAGIFKLRVSGTGANVLADYVAADVTGPRYNLLKGRGTGLDILTGDDLGSINMGAIDSTAATSDSLIRLIGEAESGHSPTSKPTKFSVWTTPTGTVVAVKALEVRQDAKVKVNVGNFEVTAGRAAFGKAIAANVAAVEANNYMGVTGETSGTSPAFYIGRTALGTDTTFSSCGAANALFLNTAVGDTVLTTNGAKSLWLGTDQGVAGLAAVKVDTSGNVALQREGASFRVKEGGTGPAMGAVNLVAGTAVVSTTAIAANSRIFLTHQNTGASPGGLRVSARAAGSTFTITSTSAADTATVAWIIFNPS